MTICFNALSKVKKHTTIIIVLLGFAFLAICWFAPYLIQTDQLKATIIERINTPFAASTTIEKIRWRWLPLPHVTLYDSHVSSEKFDIRLPKTRIYPNWLALFNHKIAIGRIYLQNPDLTVYPSFYNKNGPSNFVIPQAHLVIHDGTIRTDVPSYKGINFQTFKLSSTNVNVRNNGDHITFNLVSGSSFADTIRMNGKFLTASKEFSGKTKIKNFKLHNLITTDNPWIKPLSSTVDFEVDLLGRGTEELQLLYSGNLPDFSLQRLQKKAPFRFRNAHFILDKKNDSLNLKILNVGISHPDLELFGEVEQYFQKDADTPLYRLDLGARNIDLSSVRTQLLSLLGDSSITRIVCDIVRGGHAANGSYYFNAPSADFAHIEAMEIRANVTSSYIYIPEVDLHLKKTSGPILIKNGELSGRGLTTWLGNSYGSNGKLLLGLGADNHALKLDVIIDADISELPHALYKLIDAPVFRKEITRFSGFGRTEGHLIIGDDLRDYTIKVDIDDVDNTLIYYDRIPWPIKLKGGSLKITGNDAIWKGIAATVGLHVLNELSGETSWESDIAPTHIQSLSGTVNSESLLIELKKDPALAETINEKLEEIKGPIAVNYSSIHGPFLSPAEWEYTLDLGFNNVQFTTPLLPGTITLKKGNAVVQRNKIEFSNMLINFLNSSFLLSAKLKHSDFNNWQQGSLSADGLITGAHVSWLRAKEFLPAGFVPATPSLLDNFEIQWDSKNVSAQGTVTNKILTGKTAKADFSIQTSSDGVLNFLIDIDSEDEQGTLTILRSSQNQPLKIGWDGMISQQTLSALLAVHYIHNGHLNGAFIITLPSDTEPFKMEGQATITDLQRVWGEQLRQVSVKYLSLTGKGNEISIDDMDLEYQNESAIIKGKLLFKPDKVHLDIQQQASFQSEKTLSNFIDDLSYFFSRIKGPAESTTALAQRTPSILAGEIILRADSFLLNTGDNTQPGEKGYVIQPLQAVVDLSNPNKTSVKVGDSQICGLPIKGTLQWSELFSQKDFTLATPEETTLAFEEFLPCLGVEKKLIEGPFSVEATLTDINGDLTAGKFSLQSEKGTLWRLVFLSKIFQLINFTDLYNGLFKEGFPYTLLDLNAHIEKNLLIFDKAVIEGEGLDLLIQGSVNLKNSEADLTVFIVPLKTVDTIIRNIPLVGKTIIRLVGGRKGHIITIPVSVTGDIKDPVVKLMPTKAVGKAAIEWLLDTVTYPMELLPGVEPISESADYTNIEEEESSDAEILEETYNQE